MGYGGDMSKNRVGMKKAPLAPRVSEADVPKALRALFN